MPPPVLQKRPTLFTQILSAPKTFQLLSFSPSDSGIVITDITRGSFCYLECRKDLRSESSNNARFRTAGRHSIKPAAQSTSPPPRSPSKRYVSSRVPQSSDPSSALPFSHCCGACMLCICCTYDCHLHAWGHRPGQSRSTALRHSPSVPPLRLLPLQSAVSAVFSDADVPTVPSVCAASTQKERWRPPRAGCRSTCHLRQQPQQPRSFLARRPTP